MSIRKKKLILVVVTARSSYTKFKTVLKNINKSSLLELKLICSGSAILDRFGDLESIIRKDNLEISEKIYFTLEQEKPINSAKSTSLAIAEFSNCFNRFNPDLVMIMADRYEVIGPAIAAAYLNIPLAHVQGGEISGNIDEKVRHAITKLADLHFPATKQSYQNIIQMGEDKNCVFFTGCPSIDIAKRSIKKKLHFYDRYQGVGYKQNLNKKFAILMFHSDTYDYSKSGVYMTRILDSLHELKLPTIVFWPNQDVGGDLISKSIRKFREKYKSKYFYFIKNISPDDFLNLLNKANLIIGNSSAGIRESSYLGTLAINIGKRQEGRERDLNIIDIPPMKKAIKESIKNNLNLKFEKSLKYGNGEAGKKIVKILENERFKNKKRFNQIKFY
tara:strand:- start:146 stop:1312 length:1167 start_codon:yes stop_codon:yes gene_type:complete